MLTVGMPNMEKGEICSGRRKGTPRMASGLFRSQSTLPDNFRMVATEFLAWLSYREAPHALVYSKAGIWRACSAEYVDRALVQGSMLVGVFDTTATPEQVEESMRLTWRDWVDVGATK